MQSHKSKSLTPPFAGARIRSFAMILCTLTAVMVMQGCATLTKPSPAGPEPLAIASCPELTPLSDDSFGATTSKLVEVAGIYRECRAAALAGVKR